VLSIEEAAQHKRQLELAVRLCVNPACSADCMRAGWLFIAMPWLAMPAAAAMDARPQLLDVEGVRVSLEFLDSDFTNGAPSPSSYG
jgi:hypothetical protein